MSATAYKRIRILLATLVVTTLTLLPLRSSSALSGSDFQAARIISDSVFFNPGPMSAQDIQVFLNTKVPTCDTNGQQTLYDPSYNDTVTRQVYSSRRGVSTPFICLKDYSQDTPAKALESGLCNALGGGVKSSAQIIYDVSQACGINAKVLLVLLQKEQNLVTDDWPWPVQYQSATGYGCPDTAACDSTYYGFFNQVYSAARQFKNYAKSPSSFNYIANRNNYIQYNPNTSCGGSNVQIQTQATAGLYNYTPYQPNQAALSNLYGTGDSCSAYGNRNFWRMFNDWFGSTETDVPYAWTLESLSVYADSARSVKYNSSLAVQPGNKVYITVRARNAGSQIWTPDIIRLGTWQPADRTSIFYDQSWVNIVRPTTLLESIVSPGQTGTFMFTLSAPPTPGTYREFFNIVAENKTWLNDISLHFDIDVVNPVAASNSTNISLETGQVLHAGEYLLSPDRQSVLILQKDGNLVLYSDFKPVWFTNTVGLAADKLIMQGDGNLVLYDKNNKALWNTETPGSGTNNKVTLQTDGNMVLYSSTGSALWATYTLSVPNHLSHVNYNLSSATLYQGQQLETADRKYRLVLQEDGNLVLYSPTRALWATYTLGKYKPYLIMQGDGNLVLYDANGTPLWNTMTNGQGPSHLIMQGDGNLVIYNQNNHPIWNTATQGQQ